MNFKLGCNHEYFLRKAFAGNDLQQESTVVPLLQKQVKAASQMRLNVMTTL